MHKFVRKIIFRMLERRWDRNVEDAVGRGIRFLRHGDVEKMEDWRNFPNQRLGSDADPYLDRWFVIPKNRIFNVYLHHFHRGDDDRALHDHPWLFNASWVLDGGYIEKSFARRPPKRLKEERWDTPDLPPTVDTIVEEGTFKFRPGKAPHRIVLHRKRGLKGSQEQKVWSLFITGPNVRKWGFYCPKRWVHWKRFTGADGMTGAGCD